MSVIITIETKSGKEIKMDASEARDVYRQLGEIFNPQDYKLDELKKACEIAREKVESAKQYAIPDPPLLPMLKPFDLINKTISIRSNQPELMCCQVGTIVNNTDKTLSIVKMQHRHSGEYSETPCFEMDIEQAKELRDFLTFALWKA